MNENEITKGTLTEVFEQVETILENVIEPRGWKHFDSNRLAEEKVKVLKKFDLSSQEIVDFMNSMPNSRNVNDTIRKIKAKGGLEQFLRWSPQEKSITKQAIERMIKQGY